MDEYTKRHGSRVVSSSKPECFGDLDIYDSRDDVCQDCSVRRSCKVIVEKKMRQDSDSDLRDTRLRRRRRSEDERGLRSRRNTERKPKKPRRNDKTEPPRLTALTGESWLAALAYNSVLGASKVMLLEAHYGIESIPLLEYPNPFQIFMDDD